MDTAHTKSRRLRPTGARCDDIPVVDPWEWEFQRIRRAWEVYRVAHEPPKPPAPKPPKPTRADYYRPVVCRDLDLEYPSIRDAARAMGVKRNSIADACATGNRCRGFLWRFK